MNHSATITEIEGKINEANTIVASTNVSINTAATAASIAVKAADRAEVQAERLEVEIPAHLKDTSLHFSTQDRTDFEYMKNLFKPAIVPGSNTAPDEAIDLDWFNSYFARYAQPGMTTAPGNVFVSRVPFATQNADGSWQNTGSTIDTTVYAETDVKLLDNTGLRHKCSTDVTENEDDYVGKKWAFYWNRCNYIKDEFGVKWITAIEGETAVTKSGAPAVFDPKKNIGSFGPAIWAFCVLDTGWGLNADGTPGHQIWGIGDRRWSELSGDRQQWLTDHGVREVDYNLWSTAKYYDAASSSWKERPYIVESAYCGTAEVGGDGTIVGFGSKLNEPPLRKSYPIQVNAMIGNKGGGGARAQALGMMFDIVKNATKNSQTIHPGFVTGSSTTSARSTVNLLNPGYVFPITSAANIDKYSTAHLSYGQIAEVSSTQGACIKGPGMQIGRIKAIENRVVDVITSEDPTVTNPTHELQTHLCLVFDEETLNPFLVRNSDKLAETLVQSGYYACSQIKISLSLAGETSAYVIGKHDGYVTGTKYKHPYRVQGLEFDCGCHQIYSDTLMISANGQVTLPDMTLIDVSTSQVVYLYAPSNVLHRTSGTLPQLIDNGYVVIGVGIRADGYIYNGFVDTHYGMWYPTHIGATDVTGHGDYLSASGATTLSVCRGSGYDNTYDLGSIRSGSACIMAHVATRTVRGLG